MIFKTKISIGYLSRALFIFLLISIIAAYKSNGDFFRLAIIIYGCNLLFIFSFDLFFKSSIILTDKYLIINYSPFLFFLKPIKQDLNDIQSIVFYYFRGKGVFPRMEIATKSSKKQVSFTFLLINHISVIELSEHLKKININLIYIDTIQKLEAMKHKK
jgi:hypothetical protein